MGRRRNQPTVPPPSLLDPSAREKLEQAAAAIGLTLVQLVDLVNDSGALSLAPEEADGITSKVTLKDLGKRMWGELRKVLAPDRSEWFNKLVETQRIALVVAMMDEGYRPEVIARDLGLSNMRVREVYNLYADRIGSQVTQLRLSTIAGHVQLAAERAMEGLAEKKDWKGYFNVQHDVVKILQSLGIVEQAIHRVEVTHKLEDNTQAEIEAMLELERKQQRRRIEIEMANNQQVDSVPQLEFEKNA